MHYIATFNGGCLQNDIANGHYKEMAWLPFQKYILILSHQTTWAARATMNYEKPMPETMLLHA